VVSVALLIALVAKYGLRDDVPPRDPEASQPHTGAAHFDEIQPTHEGGTRSPLQVFSDAKVGDWIAYRVITESSIAPTVTATAIERITNVDATKVGRSFAGRIDATGEVGSKRYEDRPRQDLTLDQLAANDVAGWTIYEVAVSDDVHEVGGRQFKCKKISFSSRDPLTPKKRMRTDLWISDQVPAGGLVEEREVQELSDVRSVITKQLIGFGNASTTTWGTKPKGLLTQARRRQP
jgi:hypothetical protein